MSWPDTAEMLLLRLHIWHRWKPWTFYVKPVEGRLKGGGKRQTGWGLGAESQGSELLESAFCFTDPRLSAGEADHPNTPRLPSGKLALSSQRTREGAAKQDRQTLSDHNAPPQASAMERCGCTARQHRPRWDARLPAGSSCSDHSLLPCVSTRTDLKLVAYLFHGVLFSNEKRWPIATCNNNMHNSPNNYATWKRPDTGFKCILSVLQRSESVGCSGYKQNSYDLSHGGHEKVHDGPKGH